MELVASSASFCLDPIFVQKYVGRQPEWGPLGYVTYKRTYARSLDTVKPRHRDLGHAAGLNGTEEWWLTLVRVVEGTYNIQLRHCEQLRLPWDPRRAQRSAQEMYRLMWDFKFLPPGRGLWMMGTEIVEKGTAGAALSNCAFVSTTELLTSFSAPFCFLMDMSMLGVGVGGDTRGAGKVTICAPDVGSPYVVDDSREGWVDLVRRVLDSYVGLDTYPQSIDYSRVRPAGSPIRGFGGTASGPEPLEHLVVSITELLDARIGKKIRSSDIVDLFNMIGRCVVAGNVRRSAEIMFGDPTDTAFLELKDPEKNKKALDGWRWASNNSIFAAVGQDYLDVSTRTAKNGEPGYMWLENARAFSRMGGDPDYADMGVSGGNPCNEQSLESFELCCLVETFPSRHTGYEEYERTLKFAYLYAKTVTLVPTHDHRTNAVLLRNRRIGTSQSGIVQAMKRHGRREYFTWCDDGYRYLRTLDAIYSRWLCVPKSIKITSVKPSGTVSLLPGVTPGIHYPESEYYYRVIRFATDSPLVRILKRAGYRCIEIDPLREPNTTAVYFPVQEKFFDRGVREVSMWEQLENAAQVQQYWADNQVSVTVKFDREKEGSQIRYALELYETRLKGVSFLPYDDHGYEHAPYQPISREEYEAYAKTLGLYDLNEIQNEVQDRFCDGDKCDVSQKANA